MANRYWVGGTGRWNDTAHWSASNGGSSGASVPTSADDVFITTSSGSNFTLGFHSTGSGYEATQNWYCKSITFSNSTVVYLAGAWNNLNVSGDFKILSGSPVETYEWLYVNLNGQASFLEIQSSGYLPIQVTINGTYSLSGPVKRADLGISVAASGSLSCGSYAIGLSASDNRPNLSFSGTVNFGSAAHYIGYLSYSGASAVNYSSSTLNLYGLYTYSSSNLQLGTVNFFPQASGNASYVVTVYGSGAILINTLNVNASSTQAYSRVTFNVPVNGKFNVGNLNVVGTSSSKRMLFTSTGISYLNMTAPASYSIPYTDFSFISVVGATFSGISVYTLAKTSGVTASSADYDLYWVGGNGNFDDAAHWSTSSGGAGGAGVPSVASRVHFDTNSGNPTVSYSGNSYYIYVRELTTYSGAQGSLAFMYFTCCNKFKNSGSFLLAFSAFDFMITAATADIDLGNSYVNSNAYLCVTNCSSNSGVSINQSGKVLYSAGIYVGYSQFNSYSHANASNVNWNTNNYTLASSQIGSFPSSGYYINFGTSEVIFTSRVTNCYFSVQSASITGANTAYFVFESGTYDNYLYGPWTGGSYVFPQNAKFIGVADTAGYVRFNSVAVNVSLTNVTFGENARVKFAAGAFNFSASNWLSTATVSSPATIRSETDGSKYNLYASPSAVSLSNIDVKDSAVSGSNWTAISSIDSGNNSGWVAITPPIRGNGLLFGSNF